jgi:type-F conjugative transfer system pilin assembly thiol-disulfide isomerase TrbB
MSKGLFFLILWGLAMPAVPNVALDELKMLLNKKQEQQTLAQSRSKKIQEFRKQYSFIFIYRSTCPHCHQFAPVLYDFTSYYHIPVQAYSLDGQPLEGFDATSLTPELFQTLYVSGGYKPVVPALYLIHRPTTQAYAVLFGEAQPAQLAKRVDELMSHLEEQFHD